MESLLFVVFSSSSLVEAIFCLESSDIKIGADPYIKAAADPHIKAGAESLIKVGAEPLLKVGEDPRVLPSAV